MHSPAITDSTPDRQTLSPRPLGIGAAWTATGQIALAVAGAGATLAAARILGPAGAGAFAVATAFLLGLVTLGTLGLESGILFRVGSRLWPARRAWRETQWIALVFGLLGAGAGVGLALLVPAAFQGLPLGLVVALAAALPFGLTWIYASAVALAEDRYEDAVAPTLVQAAVLLVGVVALALAFGVEGAVAGLVLAHVAAAAVSLRRSRRALGRHSEPPGPGNLRAALGFGLKTYGANALQLLNYRLDLFVLNAVAAGAVVGRYSVAVSVTSLVWLLPRALSAVLLPRVAALRELEADRAEVEAKAVRQAVVLVGVSSAVVAVGLALVPFVYGGDFSGAIGLGFLLLPGAALLGIANVLMATVVGRGRPGLALLGSAVSTPVSVGLYVLLIPPFGAPAAALTTTGSYALSFILAAAFYRRVTGAGLRSRLAPTRAELGDLRLLMRAVRRDREGRTGATALPSSSPAAQRSALAAALGRPGSRG